MKRDGLDIFHMNYSPYIFLLPKPRTEEYYQLIVKAAATLPTNKVMSMLTEHWIKQRNVYKV